MKRTRYSWGVLTVRKVVAPLLALLLLVAGQACGGPTMVVQQYSGPVRPAETVAVIRVDGNERVVLMSLDNVRIGIRVESDSRLHVEVLPAKHLLVVVDAGDPSVPAQRVAFRAEAGKVYRPVFAASEGGQALARIYEVDRESDALIRDVTLPHDERERAAAPGLQQTPEPPPTLPAPSDGGALEEPTDARPGSDVPAPASQDDAGTDSGW